MFVCPLDVRMGQKVIFTAAGVGVLCWPSLSSQPSRGLTLRGPIHCPPLSQESRPRPGRPRLTPQPDLSGGPLCPVSCSHLWKDGLALVPGKEGLQKWASLGVSPPAKLRPINLLKFLRKHNLPLIYMRGFRSSLFLLSPWLRPYSLQNNGLSQTMSKVQPLPWPDYCLLPMSSH